jgi:hypothetical protein
VVDLEYQHKDMLEAQLVEDILLEVEVLVEQVRLVLVEMLVLVQTFTLHGHLLHLVETLDILLVEVLVQVVELELKH